MSLIPLNNIVNAGRGKTAGFLRRFAVCAPAFLFFFFSLFPSLAQGAELLIEMPERIESRGGSFLLGEYAKIEGEKKILSPVSMVSIAPVGGKISRKSIVSALSRGGFGGVNLTLRMVDEVQVVSESSLAQKLRESTGWSWRIDIQGVKKEELGRFTLPDRVVPGARNLVVRLVDEQGRAHKRQVKLTWYRPTLFAVRDLLRGEALRAEDFEHRVAPAGYREDAVSSWEEVVGASLVRAVSAGRPLERGALSIEGGVLSGRPVILVGKVGGLIIETQGIALERGAIGAMIRVRNLSSRKIVYGRVVDAGRVEISRPEGGTP